MKFFFCFCYIDSAIPPFPKYEISNLLPFFVAVQPGLRPTWSETSKTGLLLTRLKCTCTGHFMQAAALVAFTPGQIHF